MQSRSFAKRQQRVRSSGPRNLSRRLFFPKILIQESTIPGANLGAYANRNFARGTVLGQQVGRKCTLDEEGPQVLYVEGQNEDGNYVRRCVDAEDSKMSNWTRQINSVREGDGLVKNAQFKIVGNRIGVVSIRDIRKGEEIFVDQGRDYWLDS